MHSCAEIASFLGIFLNKYGNLFQLPGKVVVNVGIGMVTSELKKRKVKLKSLQKNIIETNPIFSKKFSSASMIKGSGKAALLPFAVSHSRGNKVSCSIKYPSLPSHTWHLEIKWP